MAANWLALAIASLLLCSMAAPTIQADLSPLPAPVTGNNSGPRYDIDMGTNNLVDPTPEQKQANKPTKEDEKEEAATQARKLQNTDAADKPNDDDQANPGRLAIRRLWIYSDPMQPRVRPMNPWLSASPMEHMQRRPTSPDTLFSMMSATSDADQHYVNPFVASHGMLPPTRTHVINPFRSIFSDVFSNEPRDDKEEATRDEDKEETRPTSTSTNVETESRPTTTTLMKTVDPHQLILDLLQQALSTRMEHFGSDFGSPSLTPDALSPAESTQSEKPEMKTESKEDIVEIGGEKYLRKTVISKHVGDNVMFMTKKYILTPLNETASETASTDKTNSTEPVQIDKRQEGSTTVDKPAESPSTSTATPIPSASTNTNATASSSAEVATSGVALAEPATSGSSPTPKESVSSTSKDTIEKEGEAESVAKELPEFSSPPETRERVVKRKGGRSR